MQNHVSISIRWVQSFFNTGHARSIKAKKNILSSFLLKGVSISISLLLVPLIINYVNPSRYGIWLTISSIVAWASFFDIGLTQGLRNKFALAKAEGNDSLAQTYVSTTYVVLTAIFVILWVIFITVNQSLDWASILNVPAYMKSEVSSLVVIVFTYFCFQFVLRIITTIITADQQPAKVSLIDVCGQGVSLAIIAILVATTEGSLIKLGVALCLSPVLVLLAANFFFFKREYKNYKPRLSKVKLTYAKGLFGLGLMFFIIQIAGLIQYESANIIIARSFGTSEVTSYNIVYKYFGLLNMVFLIFVTPFWSSSTEAYAKKETMWIKNGIKKFNWLSLLLLTAGIFMLLFSQQVYDLWLGSGTVSISFLLSFWGLLYFGMTMFVTKYVFFLNGINALRIQFFACIISPFIFVGVAYILIDYYHLGVYSLFIASIVANFNGIILAPLQYHMIINKNKKGIWIK